nr:hypothetical protein Iba_chr01cCG1210 [Ipomoea batatas]
MSRKYSERIRKDTPPICSSNIEQQNCSTWERKGKETKQNREQKRGLVKEHDTIHARKRCNQYGHHRNGDGDDHTGKPDRAGAVEADGGGNILDNRRDAAATAEEDDKDSLEVVAWSHGRSCGLGLDKARLDATLVCGYGFGAWLDRMLAMSGFQNRTTVPHVTCACKGHLASTAFNCPRAKHMHERLPRTVANRSPTAWSHAQTRFITARQVSHLPAKSRTECCLIEPRSLPTTPCLHRVRQLRPRGQAKAPRNQQSPLGPCANQSAPILGQCHTKYRFSIPNFKGLTNRPHLKSPTSSSEVGSQPHPSNSNTHRLFPQIATTRHPGSKKRPQRLHPPIGRDIQSVDSSCLGP